MTISYDKLWKKHKDKKMTKKCVTDKSGNVIFNYGKDE